MGSKKAKKSNLMTRPWRLINCNWGIQICEGNRVIVAISEPNSRDNGPRRTEDVMERAMAILALPDIFEALRDILDALDDEFQPAFIHLQYTDQDLKLINAAKAAMAKLKSRPVPPTLIPPTSHYDELIQLGDACQQAYDVLNDAMDRDDPNIIVQAAREAMSYLRSVLDEGTD